MKYKSSHLMLGLGLVCQTLALNEFLYPSLERPQGRYAWLTGYFWDNFGPQGVGYYWFGVGFALFVLAYFNWRK